MTTHTLTGSDDRPWGGRRFPHRLLIAGSDDTAGWGVMLIPAGEEARRVNQGPMVPGPWADVFGLPGIIDNHGGSAADMRREDAAGLLVRLNPGDVLVLDGERFTVAISDGVGGAGAGRGWYRRGYPILRHESEQVPA